jgi:hypothetical protein
MSILDKIKHRFTRQGLVGPACWIAAAAFTFVHVFVLTTALIALPLDVTWWLGPLLIVFPGIVTMTLLPGGWKRWYRWGALLGLAMMFLNLNSNPFVVILFGQTWMLHRALVTERTVPVKDLFRRRKPQEPASAPGRKPKGSRRPKPA